MRKYEISKYDMKGNNTKSTLLYAIKHLYCDYFVNREFVDEEQNQDLIETILNLTYIYIEMEEQK